MLEGPLPRPLSPFPGVSVSTEPVAATAGPFMTDVKNNPGSTSTAGFTLVEALVAISMTALAGSVLLLGVTSSLQNTDEALRQTIALGLAQQLMDAVVGAGSIEEIDRYHGFSSRPPADRWGVELGTEDGHGGKRHSNFRVASGLLSHYGREVHVYHVGPGDLTLRQSRGTTSDYRLVEVCVTYHAPNNAATELVRMQRVVAYVPPYEPLQ